MLRRILIAVALATPGILLAFVAKPLMLGEGALLLGILLAFGVPVAWLFTRPSSPAKREQP
jgi:hypothetical protein